MPSNKDRLYVTLFVRSGAAKMPGKQDTYHWALIVAPKSSSNTGTQFHAKERFVEGGSAWQYEEKEFSPDRPIYMQLVRVAIAKVKDHGRLLRVMQSVPIRQGQAGWNCIGWVKEAIEMLDANGKTLGTCATDWSLVEKEAMEFCQRKRDAHRFDGKGDFDQSTVATFDLITRTELVF